MKVAVLGCGPAGLMACHAAVEEGHDVTVLSHKVMSPMGGAQYLHESLPGLHVPGFKIRYTKVGNASGYAQRVYGDPNAPTSWDQFPDGEVEAWSLARAYEELALLYWSKVKQHIVTPGGVARVMWDYDLVLCSLPAFKLCQCPDVHQFHSQEVRLWQQQQPIDATLPSTIIYNGLQGEGSPAWYRASNIDRHGWVEWAVHDGLQPNDVPVGAAKGLKPLHTDCTCHIDHPQFKRIGRFGKWQKAVLVNHAYHDTKEALATHAVH